MTISNAPISREETAGSNLSVNEESTSREEKPGDERYCVCSRQPSPDHKHCFLDIGLVGEPESIVIQTRVCYVILAAFCSPEYIQRNVGRRPDGCKTLMLPADKCEPWGVETAIWWMEYAYRYKSESILPPQFLDLRLGAIYAERALAVLGLHREAKRIRLDMDPVFSTHDIDRVEFLQALLELPPRRNHWVKKALDYIRRCLANYSQKVQQNENQPICKVCGVSILDSPSVHTIPEGLVEWVMRDETLRKAVIGTYKTSRYAHLHMDIAADCILATVSRTETWIMNVEDHESHPFGQFPNASDLIGDVTKRIPAHRRGSGSECIYRLEWSERDGGCYIETYSSRPVASSSLCRMQATEMSREWLASRGYRGKSTDFGSIRSTPPELGWKAELNLIAREKIATPKIRALSF